MNNMQISKTIYNFNKACAEKIDEIQEILPADFLCQQRTKNKYMTSGSQSTFLIFALMWV